VLSLLGFTTPDPMPLFYPSAARKQHWKTSRTYLIRKTALTPPSQQGEGTRSAAATR
jgi:hypothetical protein